MPTGKLKYDEQLVGLGRDGDPVDTWLCNPAPFPMYLAYSCQSPMVHLRPDLLDDVADVVIEPYSKHRLEHVLGWISFWWWESYELDG